ncbi:tumor necrosis factor-like isoform X1 [Chiloscyllium punctatum]|uniref:tumor necrosis factor-like isoform X1 n=1 Tax=Chiloscyllium punctatum TaxID=137246 RepID=UPI003B63E006
MNFINVACLVLSLISTAISIGVLIIYRTDSSNAAPSIERAPKVPETSIGPAPEPEPLKKVKFFQGLKSVTRDSSKLEWISGDSINSSHNITEKGNYFVYVQVTFKGQCLNEDLLLKTTLCKKEVKILDKELLVTSVSVCENATHGKWTRTLSQAAIFYFEKGDNIHINTTTMEYVDFYHNYNNIFGIYRL